VSSPWFRSFRPSPAATSRLVCFPHAGGAASFFGSWAKALPPEIDLKAVQYPGREDRINEPFVRDLNALALDIARAVPPLLELPTAFFGHSMGAAVACAVARCLQSNDTAPVSRLFVSGQPAPHRCHPPTDLHLRGDEALLAEIARLGLGWDVISAYPELRQLVLPIVRADYALAEKHRAGTEPLLRCPITALLGDSDGEANASEMLAWQDCTSASFELRVFDGGHFYLTEQREELTDVISQHMRVLKLPDCWAPA
jgi:pyochelin biosynthetic protein PchC